MSRSFTLPITFTQVDEGMPDADLDVLLFQEGDDDAQLGAYLGDNDGPLWIDAQGAPIINVTHWAHMPNRKAKQ